MSATKKFTLKLTNTYPLNSRMRHLEFEILGDRLEYIPGQFISLQIPHEGHTVRRNFSIANSPSKHNKIEIAATFVPNGIASTMLWNMQIGDRLQASGPLGIFILPNHIPNIKRYILVATGTGVTPYRAMLNQLSDWLTDPTNQCVLLLGVRDYQELLYKADFTNFANNYPNFKFISCYSRENPADSNYPVEPLDNLIAQRFGYVQQQFDSLDINAKNDLIYLCGNPNMVEESLTMLEPYKIPKHKIKREKYISSK